MQQAAQHAALCSCYDQLGRDTSHHPACLWGRYEVLMLGAWLCKATLHKGLLHLRWLTDWLRTVSVTRQHLANLCDALEVKTTVLTVFELDAKCVQQTTLWTQCFTKDHAHW